MADPEYLKSEQFSASWQSFTLDLHDNHSCVCPHNHLCLVSHVTAGVYRATSQVVDVVGDFVTQCLWCKPMHGHKFSTCSSYWNCTCIQYTDAKTLSVLELKGNTDEDWFLSAPLTTDMRVWTSTLSELSLTDPCEMLYLEEPLVPCKSL